MYQTEIANKVTEAIKEDPNKDFIKTISLFGSFLHGDANDDSDIDLLYETDKIMSLFQISATRNHLEQKLGRKVDFVDRDSVISQLIDDIIPSAKIIYARK